MTSNEIVFMVVFFILFLCLAVYLNLRPYKKAKMLIDKWANDNNYKVIRKERKIGFDRGPFICGGWTAIYKIVIKDSEGKIQTVWTKTGNYLWPFSDNFIVKGNN